MKALPKLYRFSETLKTLTVQGLSQLANITDSFRYVACSQGSFSCSCKLLYNAGKEHHSKNKFFSGINSFWIFYNNSIVVDNVTDLSKQKKPHITPNNYTFGIITIPHEKLNKTLMNVRDFEFKDSTQEKIFLNHYEDTSCCC